MRWLILIAVVIVVVFVKMPGQDLSVFESLMGRMGRKVGT